MMIILLIIILLMAIDRYYKLDYDFCGYYIISYCWLFYVILWLLYYKLLLVILGYIIIGYW